MVKRKKVDIPELDKDKLPAHVAIIMDGNGRWAKKRLLPRMAGHVAGVDKVKAAIRMSSDLGIRYLTLYAFSTENWKRSDEEVGALMKLVVEALKRELDEMHGENVRFNTIGDTSAFPGIVREALENAIQKTKGNTGITVNFALNYGSRAEIVSAVKKIAEKVEQKELRTDQINEEVLADNLYTAGQPDPDLLIRTSGEQRLSNYLLYQLAYAEFYFTPAYWPDFGEEEYGKALLEYQSRKRRYGGV